jgi:hypothetical protein
MSEQFPKVKKHEFRYQQPNPPPALREGDLVHITNGDGFQSGKHLGTGMVLKVLSKKLAAHPLYDAIVKVDRWDRPIEVRVWMLNQEHGWFIFDTYWRTVDFPSKKVRK